MSIFLHLSSSTTLVCPSYDHAIQLISDWDSQFSMTMALALSLWQIHDARSVLVHLDALEGLGHVIRFHFIGWTVPYNNVTFLNLICNEKITNVNVPRSLTSTCHPSALQFDGTLIILIE